MATTSKNEGYKPSNDSDELNPKYIFNMTATELLVAIATGKLDAKEMAKQQLVNRGKGRQGTWIGFDNARKEWGL
ncbi:hypothetical protein BH11BAC1_BH11BAC1_16650 [soil metagenome]